RVEAMRGAMPSLALQGPASRDILRRFVHTSPHTPSLDDLKWFGMTLARVGTREGPLFMLTRTGYTGELGYELFMTRADALTIWDALSDAGAPLGLTPMGGEALNILRVEAGLMAAGAEFAPGVDAWEAGLGFTLSMKKADFVGRAALERNSTAPRRNLIGLLLDGDDVPSHGDPVLAGERPVGVITSGVRSPTLERAIAMARVAVEYSAPGTQLAVGRLDGHMKRLSATTTTIPFIDPERRRPRA
ncbi:MAG: aminomethyltransferase family protein, partial [Pseudomonadota bacterium]